MSWKHKHGASQAVTRGFFGSVHASSKDRRATKNESYSCFILLYLGPQVTLSLSEDVPLLVQYRINDIGHISCAPLLARMPRQYRALCNILTPPASLMMGCCTTQHQSRPWVQRFGLKPAQGVASRVDVTDLRKVICSMSHVCRFHLAPKQEDDEMDNNN